MMEEKIEVLAVTNDWSLLLQKLEAVENSDVALYKETPIGNYYYSKRQKETSPDGKIRLVCFYSPEQAKKLDQFKKNMQPCKEMHRKICATIGANSALAMERCQEASDMKAAIARNLANFPTATS